MRRRMSTNCRHARFDTARPGGAGVDTGTPDELDAGTTRPGDVAGGSRPGELTRAGAEGSPRWQDPAVAVPTPAEPSGVPVSTSAEASTVSTSAMYQPSVCVPSLSISVSGKPIAAPTWRIAMRGRKVTTLATIPVRSGPYLSYTYCRTCSRWSVEKSMSMSGVPWWSSCRNRSKSRSWATGSTRVMPSRYATIEFCCAAASLPRDTVLAGVSHDVPGDEEELRELRLLDDMELALQARRDGAGHGVVLALHRLLTEAVQHRERCLALGHGIAGEAHVAEVERHLAAGGDARRVVERLGKIGEQGAELRLGVEAMLTVGQEQSVRRRLVERGAMTDRGEHVEQRFVVDGGVVRGRARHQRDVRRARDGRTFRDEPSVGGMQVIAHEQRRTVATEALPQQVRVTERVPAIAAHEGVDHGTPRTSGDRDAVVERRGIHVRRLGLDEQRRRRQPRPPLGERPRRGPERRRPLRRRQRLASPGSRRVLPERRGSLRHPPGFRRVTERGDAAPAS